MGATHALRAAYMHPKCRMRVLPVLWCMKTITTAPSVNTGFDLFRLTKSKEVVDLAPNTIRKFARDGLPIYRCGKATFISRSELAAFIRTQATGGAM